MFSSSLYRAKYENYLQRIQGRVNAKKLDLEKFFSDVMTEVKVAVAGNVPSAMLDDDENHDWVL